jgi:prostaglandin-endoperoxide synthase 2
VACRFPRVTSFDQISSDERVCRGLRDVYGHVDEIEF